MEFWPFVFEVVLLFGAALLLGAVFERFRQSAILGYLLAGTLLGPSALNLVTSMETVEFLAEIGVALLLFTIGLEFSFQRFRSLGRAATLGGALQMGLTVGAGALLARVAGFGWTEAIAIGTLVAPSSTAIVLRVLMEQSALESQYGRFSMGILLFQDLSVIPLVVLLTVIGGGGGFAAMVTELTRATGLFVLLVTVFFLVSIFIVPRLLDITALARNRELPILLATSVCLAATWAAHALHVSPALGAFVAGMMLAGSPFATQLRADIGTLRILFVTLFFVSVGMLADVGWAASNAGKLLLFVPVLVLGKTAVVWGALRWLQPSSPHALAAGVCLAQGGEFCFVLARTAADESVMGDETIKLVLSSVLLSMLVTPIMVRFAPSIAREVVNRLHRIAGVQRGVPGIEAPAVPPQGHLILVGMGPSGRAVYEAARCLGIPVTILDLNPRTIEELAGQGIEAHLGDATQSGVLDHYGVNSARAVVITVPDHEAVLSIVDRVRCEAPGVPIIARARAHRFAPRIRETGALVVDEEELVGMHLSEQLVSLLDRACPGQFPTREVHIEELKL